MIGRRAALEVLKWSSARDVLKHISVVCRLLSKLCNEDELWYELLGTDTLPNQSPKELYRLSETRYMPVISATELKKFRVHSETWRTIPLSRPIKVNRFMCMVLDADKQVFVTGGPEAQDTFSINPETGEVTSLMPLLTHRKSLSVILYMTDVYTFCGSNSTYSQASEVYVRDQKRWRKLPDSIEARTSCTPCSHSQRIYLLSGCGTSQGEYFHTVSETFHLLPMEIPGYYCTVVLCTDTELIAMQKIGYYSCDIENPPDRWEMNKFPFDFGTAFWSDSPVLSANGHYYIHQNYSSRIIKLNLTNKSYQMFQTGVPRKD